MKRWTGFVPKSLTLALTVFAVVSVLFTAVGHAQAAGGPTISDVTPFADSYVRTDNVTVTAVVRDADGVTAGNIHMFVDGIRQDNVTYDAATGVATLRAVLGQGTHTVLIRATDDLGQMSEKSWNFTVDSLIPALDAQFADPSEKTDTLETTVLLSAQDNPFGKASGVVEMQIAFDGVLDSEPWEPFQGEVTRNLMNKEGLQVVVVRVRDRAGNMSFTKGLTKVVEITPSAQPTLALSSTTGNVITLTWRSLSGATEYLVRYTDGEVLYGPFTTTETAMVIGDLDLSKTYNFEVASVNPAGTISDFTKILPPDAERSRTVTTTDEGTVTRIVRADESVVTITAAPSGQTVETTTDPTGQVVSQVETAPARPVVTTDDETVSPTPSPTATASPSPSPSPAVDGGDDDQERDWSRVIVALSILIIAAGVATGGWYLYQWWTNRPDEKGKGKGKGGRW